TNEDGLLKPGMNGEGSVLVDRRDNVVAVPNDAVRTAREAPVLAGSLGLNSDSVAAKVQAQMAAAGGGMGARGATETTMPNVAGPPRRMRRASQGEVDLVALQGAPAQRDAATAYTAPRGGQARPQAQGGGVTPQPR
ncbi:MAG: hypothetical protein ABIT38_00705, partial [Gemmatimonadaceae bacterium]